MLTRYLTPGVKLLGLAPLINSNRPGFTGCYRIVAVGAVTAIEFFESDSRSDAAAMHSVRILPYQSGKIASVTLQGGEAISGEFTGCVMAVYQDGGTSYAAHIDTNADTSQRDVWDAKKATPGFAVQHEYDTTGKLLAYPATDAKTRILCVGSEAVIHHYFVATEAHQFSSYRTGPGGDPAKWRQHAETAYTVLKSLGQ